MFSGLPKAIWTKRSEISNPVSAVAKSLVLGKPPIHSLGYHDN